MPLWKRKFHIDYETKPRKWHKRLKINASDVLNKKPNFGKFQYKSVQPNSFLDIHNEYDDEDLSPRYVKNPIKIVYNPNKNVHNRNLSRDTQKFNKNRLSLAAEHSLFDNQPAINNLKENDRYGRQNFRSQFQTPKAEANFGFKPDYRIQQFLSKEAPRINDGNESKIYGILKPEKGKGILLDL